MKWAHFICRKTDEEAVSSKKDHGRKMMTTLNLECRSCLGEENLGFLDSTRPRISHQDISDHHVIVQRASPSSGACSVLWPPGAPSSMEETFVIVDAMLELTQKRPSATECLCAVR